jgi:hypothetical protein
VSLESNCPGLLGDWVIITTFAPELENPFPLRWPDSASILYKKESRRISTEKNASTFYSAFYHFAP